MQNLTIPQITSQHNNNYNNNKIDCQMQTVSSPSACHLSKRPRSKSVDIIPSAYNVGLSGYDQFNRNHNYSFWDFNSGPAGGGHGHGHGNGHPNIDFGELASGFTYYGEVSDPALANRYHRRYVA